MWTGRCAIERQLGKTPHLRLMNLPQKVSGPHPLRLDQAERARRLDEQLPSRVTTLHVLLGELPTDVLRKGLTRLDVHGVSSLRATEMARLCAQLAASGDRSDDDLFSIVREAREYGAKRVRLFTLPPGDLANLTLPRGIVAPTTHRAAAMAYMSLGSAWRYGEITPERMRIVGSEIHERFDRDAGRYEDLPRVVTLDVNRVTGGIAVSFDPAGDRHPHGKRVADYYEYHERLFLGLFASPPAPVNIVKAAHALLAEPALAEVTLFKGRDDEGPFTIPRGRHGDARKRRLYTTAKAGLLHIDQCGLMWTAASADAAPQALSLTHRTHTKLFIASRDVVFDGDSLAPELDYVSEHIRRRA
jgi:hypothetical protein